MLQYESSRSETTARHFSRPTRVDRYTGSPDQEARASQHLAGMSPDTNRSSSANGPKTDGVKTYVDWACEQRFGVIDVNIPRHITGEEVSMNRSATSRVKKLTVMAGRPRLCRGRLDKDAIGRSTRAGKVSLGELHRVGKTRSLGETMLTSLAQTKRGDSHILHRRWCSVRQLGGAFQSEW